MLWWSKIITKIHIPLIILMTLHQPYGSFRATGSTIMLCDTFFILRTLSMHQLSHVLIFVLLRIWIFFILFCCYFGAIYFWRQWYALCQCVCVGLYFIPYRYYDIVNVFLKLFYCHHFTCSNAKVKCIEPFVFNTQTKLKYL